jgi:3-phenylpropionate/trans-cinnamate dioxygenase ferredoxin reductase subunit
MQAYTSDVGARCIAPIGARFGQANKHDRGSVMSDEGAALSGPDLTRGVSLTALGEGQLFLGHADGKPVLLVRRGEQVFAIGATCSHYGGPLAEGIVVGDTVRCPWHHACFSLRTGAALRAPALHPVSCWDVSQRDGRVFVTHEVDAASSPDGPAHGGATGDGQSPAGEEARSVVIVGGGAAGSAAADTLRRDGFEGAITIISADDDAPYDRPNISKDYLAGTAPEEWIPLRERSVYDDQRIVLRLGTRATEIDTAKHTVRLSDGSSLPYDALLLATGASPVRLPPHVDPLGRTMYLRTLADSRAIAAAAQHAGHAVVIGASFIGLEVAAALRARGLHIDVVAPEPRPLERILGPELGDVIQRIHEDHGVTFHLGTTAASIEAEHVVLGSGERIAADMVVAGIGVRPELALARQAGLSVERGVVVNEFLETSAAGIYAAGDIAQWTDPASRTSRRIEHWVVAQRQGATVARNIIARFDGRPCEPFAAVPFFWSAHYDTTISYVGHAESWDETVVVGDVRAGKMAVTYRNDGRPQAVATIGYDMLSLDTELAMERAADTAMQLGIESDATLGRRKPLPA